MTRSPPAAAREPRFIAGPARAIRPSPADTRERFENIHGRPAIIRAGSPNTASRSHASTAKLCDIRLRIAASAEHSATTKSPTDIIHATSRITPIAGYVTPIWIHNIQIPTGDTPPAIGVSPTLSGDTPIPIGVMYAATGMIPPGIGLLHAEV